eukprot:3941930-Rhodomonas_salina.23
MFDTDVADGPTSNGPLALPTAAPSTLRRLPRACYGAVLRSAAAHDSSSSLRSAAAHDSSSAAAHDSMKRRARTQGPKARRVRYAAERLRDPLRNVRQPAPWHPLRTQRATQGAPPGYAIPGTDRACGVRQDARLAA